MSLIINIDILPQDTRRNVHNYVKKIIQAQADNIVSIFIYGSATGKNYIPGKSDVNIAVILKQLQFGDLKKMLEASRWGLKKRIAVPLVLTVKHIQTSTDVFPIEFLEMKDNYCLLYGQDLLRDLPISESNIRLECEQQLKGKLIRIRQAYLEIGLNNKRINVLLKESLNSLIPIFRGMLRLKTTQAPPIGKEDIINGIAKKFGIDPLAFLRILQDREGRNKIDSKNIETIFQDYIGQIQKLSVLADRI